MSNENYRKPEYDPYPPAPERKSSGLSPAEELDAISWAANRSGQSYGVFSSRLHEDDKRKIFREYAAWQKEQRAKLHERVAQRVRLQDSEQDDDDSFESIQDISES